MLNERYTSVAHLTYTYCHSQADSVARNTVEELLSVSSLGALYNFRTESEEADRLVREEIRTRILRSVARNLSKPEAFLHALQQYNCVVSGPFVLSLVDPLSSDSYERMDVFACDHRFSDFISYLKEEEHAVRGEDSIWVDGLEEGSFWYATDMKCPAATVRIIRSPELTPLYTIPHYYSTHLMNVLFHNRLVVGYPSLTFTRKGVIIAPVPAKTAQSTFQLGDIREILPSHSCNHCVACGFRWRSFSDASCAVFPFAAEEPCKAEAEVNDRVRWRLGGRRCSAYCMSSVREVNI